MARIPFLEPTIDLSHYDLIDHFTSREAACLIAGIDPNMQEVTDLFGSPEFARMRAVEDAMEQAHGFAVEALKDMATSVDVVFDGAQPFAPWHTDLDEQGELIAMLPCLEVLREFNSFKVHRDESRLIGRGFGFNLAKFRREDITAWLQAKGYKQARYFLPSGPINKIDAAEVECLQERVAQLESELDDAYNAAKANEADFERHLAYCATSSDIQSPELAPSSGGLSFHYETDLLKLVAAVQDRYLGEHYNPDDLDTRPRKDAVIDWLIEQNPGMSNARAEAIDRVAMPFNRGK